MEENMADKKNPPFQITYLDFIKVVLPAIEQL